MNEQLQGKLVEILSGIQEGVRAAGTFAMEQLPEIAQQYVLYGRVLATFWMVLGAAFLIYTTVAVVKCLKYAREEREDFAFAFGFSAAVSAIVGMMFVCVNVASFSLVWFAPKVWLLKEIASLVK